MGTVVVLAAQVGGARLADGLYRPARKWTSQWWSKHGRRLPASRPRLLSRSRHHAFHARRHRECLGGLGARGRDARAARHVKQLGGPTPAAGRQVARRAVAARRRPGERAPAYRDHPRLLPAPGHRSAGAADERRPVRTNVLTDDGAMTFQQYYKRAGLRPAVRGLQYAGAAEARISDEVLDCAALEDLEAVVIGPANPYHGIRPILELSGMRELLRRRGAPVIAVTPSSRQGAERLGRQDDARAGARAHRARRGDRIPPACRRLRHRPRGLAFAEGVRSLACGCSPCTP